MEAFALKIGTNVVSILVTMIVITIILYLIGFRFSVTNGLESQCDCQNH